MDPTAQAFVAAVVGALVAGVAVYAWHVSERQRNEIPETEEPVVPTGVASVLSVLRSSAVLVDHEDVVRKASAPAYALGLVRGSEVTDSQLAELVRLVRRDGQIRETEIVIQ
ncbi:MAG: two-component sensor histidine kinase, partial [Nocardioides sp.]|nr:two-component sensor histidine kinase [Nocardioides sp.]